MDDDKLAAFVGRELQTRIKKKLNLREEEFVEAIYAYKQFIALKVLLKDWQATLLSPSLLVDQIWHSHVVDTKVYAAACINLCGNVIHHDPDGCEDSESREQRIQRLKDIYEKHFGVKPTGKYWYFDNDQFLNDFISR